METSPGHFRRGELHLPFADRCGRDRDEAEVFPRRQPLPRKPGPVDVVLSLPAPEKMDRRFPHP